MKGDPLPAVDHVVRYVKFTMIRDDGRPDGGNFQLRADRDDETGVSVHWLEKLGSGKEHQLAEVRRLSRLTLRRSGRLGELHVGTVLACVEEELRTLRIVEDPLAAYAHHDADPSHALMVGLPPGGTDQAMLIGDLIAECVTTMHPAVP